MQYLRVVPSFPAPPTRHACSSQKPGPGRQWTWVPGSLEHASGLRSRRKQAQMLPPRQCREGRSPDHMQEAPGHVHQTSVKSAVLTLPCCQPRRHLTFSTPTSERVPLDSLATVLGPGLFVFIHHQTASPGLTSQRRKLAQRGGGNLAKVARPGTGR